MSRLALHFLGAPRIESDGAPVHLDRRKAVALLAFLAVTGQTHNRDALATLLWPELDQGRARAGLRRTLVALRSALGGGWLESDRETVRLNSKADLWLDAAEFRRKLDKCQTHSHPSERLCVDCRSCLTEAVELYQDDFLAGFTLRDSLAFDEWQFFQTEELRQLFASALERLARGTAAQGEWQAGITHARRWVALDPLHESAQHVLTELYHHAGQSAAALRQYQIYEDTLAEELGATPSEAIRLLHERIRARDEFGPERVGRRTIPHHLSAPLTPFVGREQELTAIGERLADPNCRLLTLVGPGGIGKTHLAIQAAQQLLQGPPGNTAFSHGIFFVSLAAVSETESIVPSIASALNFLFHGEGDPKQQLLYYLREKQMLLVLDNFEHLLEGANQVTEILAAPSVKILVTSREALTLSAETLFTVGGMELPESNSAGSVELPEAVLEYAAIKLFMLSARRVRPGFELQEGDLEYVTRICHLIQGMPLGILLAAAWADILTPQEIATEIGEGIDFLKSEMRDVPERHRSIRAVCDHSWDLLKETERDAFKKLSVFRGGFTLDAAQKVTYASLRGLRTLQRKSMLHRDTNGRYQIHGMLRRYAAEKLDATPAERDRVHDRHCEYYSEFIHRRKVMIGRGKQGEVLLDFGNLRAAWRWAVDGKKSPEIRKLEYLFDMRTGWFQGADAILPDVERVIVRSVEYHSIDNTPLTMDIYYPPNMEADTLLPVVIFIVGYPDSAARLLVGSPIKDFEPYRFWGRSTAASGLIAVTYQTQQPGDLEVLVRFIRQNGLSLNMDSDRIGIWSCSANSPTAVSFAMQEARGYLKFAVFYYGFMLTPDNRFRKEIDSFNTARGVYAAELKDIEQLRKDLPLLIVRAGRDSEPLVNRSIDHFASVATVSGIPITLIEYQDGVHGFDYEQKNETSAEIIEQTLEFMRAKIGAG